MLASLLARLAPRPGRTTDDLFTPFAPHGPPVQVLRELYHRYEDALDDEFVPAQHVHYRALCDRLLGVVHGWERLEGLRLRRVISAYVACFEQSEAFQFQLSLWRDDAAFVGLLSQVRAHVTADLQRHAERASEGILRQHGPSYRVTQSAVVVLDLDGWAFVLDGEDRLFVLTMRASSFSAANKLGLTIVAATKVASLGKNSLKVQILESWAIELLGGMIE